MSSASPVAVRDQYVGLVDDSSSAPPSSNPLNAAAPAAKSLSTPTPVKESRAATDAAYYSIPNDDESEEDNDDAPAAAGKGANAKGSKQRGHGGVGNKAKGEEAEGNGPAGAPAAPSQTQRAGEKEREVAPHSAATHSSTAEYNIVTTLPEGITGTGYAPYEYNSLRCFIRAVECDVDNAAAWDNVGTSLKDMHECVIIRLRRGDVNVERGERILRPSADQTPPPSSSMYSNTNSMRAANDIHNTMMEDPDTMVDAVFNQQQCFIRAIEIDPLVSACWNKLGTTIPSGSFDDKGSDATGTRTYVEVDLSRHLPFANSRKYEDEEDGDNDGQSMRPVSAASIASSLGAQRQGRITAGSAAGDGVEEEGGEEGSGDDNGNGDDDTDAVERTAIGTVTTNMHQRRRVLRLNKRECFTRAIALNMKNAHAWYNLASLLCIKKMTIGTMLTSGLLKAGGGDAVAAAPPVAGGGGSSPSQQQSLQQQQVAADPLAGVYGALAAAQAAHNLKSGVAANKLMSAALQQQQQNAPSPAVPPLNTLAAATTTAAAADGSVSPATAAIVPSVAAANDMTSIGGVVVPTPMTARPSDAAASVAAILAAGTGGGGGSSPSLAVAAMGTGAAVVPTYSSLSAANNNNSNAYPRAPSTPSAAVAAVSAVAAVVDIALDDPHVATVAGPFSQLFYFDKKQCLVKVLECEPEDPFAWYNLACVLKRGEHIDIRMRVFVGGGEDDGAIAALNQQQGDAEHIDQNPSATTTSPMAGSSSKQLLEKVLQSRTASEARRRQRKRRTQMRTIPINAKDCCLNALKASNYTDFYTWAKLGQVLGNNDTAVLTVKDPVTNKVISSQVTGRECFYEALHLNPMFPNAWDGLGASLAKVERIHYTHPNHSMWNIRHQSTLLAKQEGRDQTAAADGDGDGADGDGSKKKNAVIIGTDKIGQPIYAPSAHAQSGAPLPMTIVPITSAQLKEKGWTSATADAVEGGMLFPNLIETLNNAACWNKAIECDARYTMAWSNLGYTMGKSDKYKVLGIDRSQRDCFLAGIACDDKGINDKAWNGLGINLKSSEQLNIKEDPSRPPPPPPPLPGMEEMHAKDITNSRKTGKKEAYGRSVLANPYNSSAWNNLGTTLGNTGSVVIDGVELYEQDCYLRAVSLNANNSAGWDNLGSTVGNKKGVKKSDADDEAMPNDDSASEASGRSNALTATLLVNGIPYTRQQCYLKAVNCNKNNSSAWGKLSGTLREGEHVTVVGVDYDRLACLQKALSCDFDNSRAWNRLGKLIDSGGCGTTEPHAVHLKEREEKKRADGAGAGSSPPVSGAASPAAGGSSAAPTTSGTGKKSTGGESEEEEEDENDATADAADGIATDAAAVAKRTRAKLNALSGAGEEIAPYVDVQGKPYNTRDCFARACECDASYTVAWYNLGTAMKGEETLTIKGKPYQKKNCYMKALECDDGNVNAWNNLGASLVAGDIIVVSGKKYDKLKCYARALEMDPANGATWTNVGCMLMSPAEVAATEAAVVAANNFSKAGAGGGGARPTSGARSRPSSARARPMSAKPNNKILQTTVDIHGASYTQIDCFIEALKNDFNNAVAWSGLGALMGLEGAPDATGHYVSRGDLPPTDVTIPDAKLPQLLPQLNLEPLPVSKHAAARLANAVLAHPLPTTVGVRGLTYTKQQCLVRAVESDRHSCSSWNNLGTTITTPEEEEKRRADRKAANAPGWEQDDAVPLPTGTVLVNNRPYSKCDCYLKAVMLDGKNPQAWANLGSAMTATDVVQYSGIELGTKTKEDVAAALAAAAAEGEEGGDQTPSALGSEFTLTAAQLANGNVLLSRAEVLSRAAELEPSNTNAWLNLALCGGFETIKLRNANPHVFSNNLSTASTCSQHGRNEDLAAMLVPTIRIGGDEITQLDCFINAVEADPLNTRAWVELAAVMREEAALAPNAKPSEDYIHPYTVEVHGEELTRVQIEGRIATIRTPGGLAGAGGSGMLPPRSARN